MTLEIHRMDPACGRGWNAAAFRRRRMMRLRTIDNRGLVRCQLKYATIQADRGTRRRRGSAPATLSPASMRRSALRTLRVRALTFRATTTARWRRMPSYRMTGTTAWKGRDWG